MSFDTTRRASAVGGFSGAMASSSSGSKQKSAPTVTTPRILEKQLGESIQFRTDILPELKELGPPDLVHITKYDRDTKAEYGEYHYCVGLNTSSSVQPYMYLQTIQLNDKTAASEKHPKVGTYCSYNCFSKGDLRIRCQFPGAAYPSVQFLPQSSNRRSYTYAVEDERSPLWLETWVSSLVRCVLFSDDIERQLPGMCKYNPIQSTKDSKEAIKAMIHMIPRGTLCGCSDLVNQPTIVSNYLVDALHKLVELTGLYDLALEQLELLEQRHKGLNANIIKVQLMLRRGDKSAAVRLMYTGIKEHSRDGLMLLEQAKFLIGQNRADLALTSATRAVECLPTEFLCWKVLIQAHMLNKNFHSALLALNSCPMYTNKKKDIFRALRPKNFSFPLPHEGRIESVWRDCEDFGCVSGYGGIVEFSPASHVDSVDPRHLTVYEETSRLHSTFREAYELLAAMDRLIGWSELLRLRSQVFVMENEYHEEDEDELSEQQQEDTRLVIPQDSGSSRGRSPSVRSRNGSVSSASKISKFRTKRLSERWLDSLFLIFYDNLKSVLIWENEKANNDATPVQHIALEWELIGDECFKAHRFESSLVPFRTCLDNRFSVFAGYQLLNYFLEYTTDTVTFTKLNGIRSDHYRLTSEYVLRLCCKLLSWNYRYYGEFSVVCLRVLKVLTEAQESDSVLIRSQIGVFFEAEQEKHGVIGLAEKCINWLEQFV